MACTADKPKSISLPVAGHAKKVKPSRASRRRAAVLIGVHVLIGLHVVHWLVKGSTLTPVEPSEAMYTLEKGELNAGFVFFVLAILATLVFGRWFCGWGCHVVALQDLCGWMMRKCGVQPKPFRSRLLMWCPLLLGLYMFVWPTFRREALAPLLAWAGVAWPEFLGPLGARPAFHNAFMTEDFWKTFPDWYVAIPFLLVCGFVTVYFMGSKAFCSYGCPYGGFFGVVDRLAPMRIRVSDACEGCGHCTATCTSNVRVHEEVRDYGMIVDPGCMKCYDCVSVCPNGALSFGPARPSLFKRLKVKDGSPARRKARNYDLSWPAEVLVFLVGLGMFLAFRGMLNQVPLLMAAGMAAVGAFFTWKLVCLVREPSVRLGHGQLKIKGRLTTRGVGFAALALGVIGAAAWSGAVRTLRWEADRLDTSITTPYEVVFAPGYAPGEAERERALRAAGLYVKSAPRAQGGFGWRLTDDQTLRVAWLLAVAGEMKEATPWLVEAGARPTALDEVFDGLRRAAYLTGGGPADAARLFRDVLEKNPGQFRAHRALVLALAEDGNLKAATDELDVLLVNFEDNPQALGFAGVLNLQMRNVQRGRELLERAVEKGPKSAGLHHDLAVAYMNSGEPAKGAEAMMRAADLAPENPVFQERAAYLLRQVGRSDAAAVYEARLRELTKERAGGR